MKGRRFAFTGFRISFDSADKATPSTSLIFGMPKLYSDLSSIILARLSRRDMLAGNRIRDAMLEPGQIRAARALLGWHQEDLSKASGVGTATIRRIENGGSPISGNVSTVMRIQGAFEKAGILFINEDETAGMGVRLAKKKRRR
jgi:DNA-binding XRE family transcriptional regulator